MVSLGLQTFYFPMTFTKKKSVFEKLIYVAWWIIFGVGIGIYSTTTSIAYLSIAIHKYEHDDKFARKNMVFTLMFYLLIQLKSAIFGRKHLRDIIFWTLGDEINWMCNADPDICAGVGLHFWWDEAWNEELCREREGGDCDLDVADL